MKGAFAIDWIDLGGGLLLLGAGDVDIHVQHFLASLIDSFVSSSEQQWLLLEIY